MNDLISRQAAIEALNKLSESTYEVDYGVIDCDDAIREIEQLPPAQLGTNLAEVGTDCISRQAAIDAVNCVMVMKGVRSWKSIVSETVESAKRIMTDNIRDLPPALPEPCEDAVSRKAVAGIYTALWETIGTIMDRDEWDDVCKATANELPPAQPEIIRCKDCKHFKQVFAPNDNDGLCGHWHSKCDARTNRNGYCSHAERREETG